MKKKLLFVIAALFFCYFITNPVIAAPISETYSLANGQLDDGQWGEAFSGGGEGQQGNVLGAGGFFADGSNIFWMFTGLLDSVIASSMSNYDYETTYIGSFGFYNGGYTPDADPLHEITNVALINNSKKYEQNGLIHLDFEIGGSAIQDGIKFTFFAKYNGVEGYNYLPDTTVSFDDTTAYPGHIGTPLIDGSMVFSELSIEASSVPVPAAVWLLGSGLLGLAGLRRKLRK